MSCIWALVSCKCFKYRICCCLRLIKQHCIKKKVTCILLVYFYCVFLFLVWMWYQTSELIINNDIFCVVLFFVLCLFMRCFLFCVVFVFVLGLFICGGFITGCCVFYDGLWRFGHRTIGSSSDFYFIWLNILHNNVANQ